MEVCIGFKIRLFLKNEHEYEVALTLVYTHLIDFKADEYITKIAKYAEEACTLIESGFDYIMTAPDGLMIFRKRK